MKNKIKKIFVSFLLIVVVLSLAFSTINASTLTKTRTSRITIWSYAEEGKPGVIVPFTQTIWVDVGAYSSTSGNILTATKSHLTGVATNGKNFPFSQSVQLEDLKWYKNNNLVTTLSGSTFSTPTNLLLPGDWVANHYFRIGERNYSISKHILSETLRANGRIRVQSPGTIEYSKSFSGSHSL